MIIIWSFVITLSEQNNFASITAQFNLKRSATQTMLEAINHTPKMKVWAAPSTKLVGWLSICMWTFIAQWGARLGDSNSGAVCYPPYSAAGPSPPSASDAAQSAQLGGCGEEWRWHWCHLAGIQSSLPPPCLSLHRGDTERKRWRDMEPQVPTSLADKSNLSLWPLTPEVAMEPSSQVSLYRWSMVGYVTAAWGCMWAAVRIIKTPCPPLSHRDPY